MNSKFKTTSFFGYHDVWPYIDKQEATSTFSEDYFEEILGMKTPPT